MIENKGVDMKIDFGILLSYIPKVFCTWHMENKGQQIFIFWIVQFSIGQNLGMFLVCCSCCFLITIRVLL